MKQMIVTNLKLTDSELKTESGEVSSRTEQHICV